VQASQPHKQHNNRRAQSATANTNIKSTMTSEGNAVALPAPIDLAELATRISTLGETIKTLKSSSEQPDADVISAAVAALLDAKRLYAATNGGIGVDGKPWEEPLTKSQKKKLEKEKKAAEAAAGVGAGEDGEKANEGEHIMMCHNMHHFAFCN
jgi:hypothetical protein